MNQTAIYPPFFGTFLLCFFDPNIISFSLGSRSCIVPEKHSCQFLNKNSVFNIALSQSVNTHNTKKNMLLNENNEQQCSRWSDYVYMHIDLYHQQFEDCGGFSADYSNFQKDLSCRSSVIWNIFANASFFSPEACSQTLIHECFRHKPVWGLWSTQPTQPESLTRIKNRTFWKLPILLFPVEAVF